MPPKSSLKNKLLCLVTKKNYEQSFKYDKN